MSIITLLRESTGTIYGIGTYEKSSPDKVLLTTDKGNTYTISKEKDRWQCSCPSFKYGGKGTCKHIEALLSNNVIKQSAERLPMNLIDDVVIPALDSTIKPYVPDWVSRIVGSYRRKKDTFKDIDVVLPLDPDTFSELCDKLKSVEGFVPVMKGPDIFRGYYPVSVDGVEKKVELDFSRQNTDSEAGMLLYRTGPAEFNMFMRQVAMIYGWSLSEKGLIDHVTGEKVDVPQETEEDIFKALKIPYLTPVQRGKWESFIDKDEFLSNARSNTPSASREVIYKLKDWFISNPEWYEIGKSLNTKDNAAALKGRLIGSSDRPKNLITHIVKSPYKYEISKAWELAYGEKLPMQL